MLCLGGTLSAPHARKVAMVRFEVGLIRWGWGWGLGCTGVSSEQPEQPSPYVWDESCGYDLPSFFHVLRDHSYQTSVRD